MLRALPIRICDIFLVSSGIDTWMGSVTGRTLGERKDTKTTSNLQKKMCSLDWKVHLRGWMKESMNMCSLTKEKVLRNETLGNQLV